jgi:parvulin-like peptidyl-prolyl isomerase
MIRKLTKKLKKGQVKHLPGAIAERAAEINALVKKDEPTVIEKVPHITNETIAVHREEVLKGARKYIYPLQHSKHRIIVVTSTLLVISVVSLLAYCGIGLYKFHQHNTFLYRATQILPLPVARVSGGFVDYENYLFELRHYIHYYEHQQQRDFKGEDKPQLERFQNQALQDVIDQAYIKKLAKQNKVSVSDKEVNDLIAEVRNQNRLGNNNKVFADVLRDYWGWSISDFKRSLKQQILADKVVAKLDTETTQKAKDALAQVKTGADFGAVAKQVSEDTSTKANGGDYGFGITKTNPNIPPQVVNQLFTLKPGETSDIINTGNALEIVKVNQNDGVSVAAQHIAFQLKDVKQYIQGLRQKELPKTYIKP